MFNRLVLLLLVAFLSFGIAQEYVITTYNFEDAGERAQLVKLSPNHLTIVDFPEIIDMVSSGNGDLLDLEVVDDRIILRPTRLAGETDLVVRLGTDTAIFSLVIETKEKKPRRYLIKTTAELDAERRQAEAEAAQAQAEAEARQQQMLAQQQAATVQAVPAMQVTQADALTPATKHLVGGLPEKLLLNLVSVTKGANDTVMISYALTNSTNHPVTLYTMDFVGNGSTLASYRTGINPYTQAEAGDVIPANTIEYGTVVVYSTANAPNLSISGSILETTDLGAVTHQFRDSFSY